MKLRRGKDKESSQGLITDSRQSSYLNPTPSLNLEGFLKLLPWHPLTFWLGARGDLSTEVIGHHLPPFVCYGPASNTLPLGTSGPCFHPQSFLPAVFPSPHPANTPAGPTWSPSMLLKYRRTLYFGICQRPHEVPFNFNHFQSGHAVVLKKETTGFESSVWNGWSFKSIRSLSVVCASVSRIEKACGSLGCAGSRFDGIAPWFWWLSCLSFPVWPALHL